MKSTNIWRPARGHKPHHPVNAFGERERLSLVLTDHLKRTRYVNEQDRLIEYQLRARYMGGAY